MADETPRRRELLVSKTWVQASVVVFLIGFFVLGLLAYRTYSADPPIADRIVDPEGQTLFTGEDVSEGQKVFLNNGLMEYGSVFGHGAYLGPDYTADYLHRAALSVEEHHGGSGSDRAHEETIADFQANRYDSETDTLTFTAEQAQAFEELKGHYAEHFGNPTTELGLLPDAIDDPKRVHELTAFFSWSAWAASARRPGHNYSYTNNWPPEELVDNGPTANVVLWSVVSLIALLGGIGLLFAAFGRWNLLGWHGREQATLSFKRPGDVALTPAQRACAWFFLVMAALFLIQTMVGAASQHYRAELGDFFGIDLAQLLPVQPRPHLPRPARDLLRIDLVPRGRDLPRADDHRAGAEAAALARLRVARRAGDRRLRQPDRRVRRRPRLVRRRRLDLRHPGVRVPRPRSLLAGPARDRAVLLGGDHLPGVARAPGARESGEPAVARSSLRRSRSRRSTRSDWSPARATASPSPTSGASGSSISGSRTSSSCSRP